MFNFKNARKCILNLFSIFLSWSLSRLVWTFASVFFHWLYLYPGECQCISSQHLTLCEQWSKSFGGVFLLKRVFFFVCFINFGHVFDFHNVTRVMIWYNYSLMISMQLILRWECVHVSRPPSLPHYTRLASLRLYWSNLASPDMTITLFNQTKPNITLDLVYQTKPSVG